MDLEILIVFPFLFPYGPLIPHWGDSSQGWAHAVHDGAPRLIPSSAGVMLKHHARSSSWVLPNVT